MARNYSSIAQEAELTGGIGAGAGSFSVDSLSGWPASTPFTAVIDPGLPSEEIVTVTAVGGLTLTVTRGEDGSTAVDHAAGSAVRHMVTGRDLREPQVHMDATTNVHGVGLGNAVVGTGTTQTLTNKTLGTGTVIPSPPTNIARLPGEVTAYAGSSTPSGWLACDGSAVSRTTYAALFAAIGTVYGVGNGSTTFNVPNLNGRVVVGQDPLQTEFNALGETGGAKTHTLTVDQMPSHTHTQNAHNHTQNAHGHTTQAHGHTVNDPGHTHEQVVTVNAGDTVPGVIRRDWDADGAGGIYDQGADTRESTTGITLGSTTVTVNSSTATNNATTATNQNTGGGQAHNNLQPYMALKYIIKT